MKTIIIGISVILIGQIAIAKPEVQKEIICETGNSSTPLVGIFSNNHIWSTAASDSFMTSLNFYGNDKKVKKVIHLHQEDILNPKKFYDEKTYIGEEWNISLKTKELSASNPASATQVISLDPGPYFAYVAEELESLSIHNPTENFDFDSNSKCEFRYSVNAEYLYSISAHYMTPQHIKPETLETVSPLYQFVDPLSFMIHQLYKKPQAIDISNATILSSNETPMIQSDSPNGEAICYLDKINNLDIRCLYKFKEKPITSESQISMMDRAASTCSLKITKNFPSDFMLRAKDLCSVQPDGILEIQYPLSVKYLHLFGLKREQEEETKIVEDKKFELRGIPLQVSHDGIPYLNTAIPYTELTIRSLVTESADKLYQSITEVPIHASSRINRPGTWYNKIFGRTIGIHKESEFVFSKSQHPSRPVSYSHSAAFAVNPLIAKEVNHLIQQMSETYFIESEHHRVQCLPVDEPTHCKISSHD